MAPAPAALRRLAALAVAFAAAGCATYSEPAAEPAAWAESVKEGAAEAAQATARGASVAKQALGTAVAGVRKGFDAPDPRGYGPAPKRYAEAIRKHLVRFEGVPGDASFRFGRPARGYLNAGLFAGGGVAWQGWLVEVSVLRATRFESQSKPSAYVARLRDGDVVEVMLAEYASALRWTDGEQTPASHTAQRD